MEIIVFYHLSISKSKLNENTDNIFYDPDFNADLF